MPHTIGQAWIDADQVLPLLDGLDEVQSEHRAACVEAINMFRRDHGLLPLAVCSRLTEYDALGVQLRLQGALVVQPLTRPQVDTYLAQVGAPLTAVREALQADHTLWELLETPLMLYVVTLVYASAPVAARRQHLFSAYVERMFQRRSAVTRYTRQQTERWLAWLAWQMGEHSQSGFYLERMQPDWLPPGQRWIPTAGVAWGVGLLLGLILGLDYGGRTCLQHVTLRLLLVNNDSAPWRYADFLDYAAERLFLRKVGGGYMFIHRLLQDYFASLYTESNDGTNQKSAQ